MIIAGSQINLHRKGVSIYLNYHFTFHVTEGMIGNNETCLAVTSWSGAVGNTAFLVIIIEIKGFCRL